jgi:pimeloyl-ACP methyl ester carboxylesterase
VVLISGSGSQDRNESIFGHQPFWVIADYLSRNGIAVLRYDDRGVGKSGGTSHNCTSADFATDAKAGMEYLKTRKEIVSKKIGFMGHSEGGLIAPMIAANYYDVAFIILLAGPGINGEQILYQQKALIEKTMGLSDEQVAEGRKMSEKIFETLKTEPDSALTAIKLREIIADGKYSELGQTEKILTDAEIAKVNSKWFRNFITYDPVPSLKKVKCPVLALNGGKDLQVPPKTNLPVIEQALKDGKCKSFKTMEIPDLNHLFQHSKTGSTNEYAEIEETFSPEVLEIIKHWIVNVGVKQ